MKEVGTLKELNVKPGDVVEFVKGFDGMYPNYIGMHMIGNDCGGVKFGCNNGLAAQVDHIFRIITRAANTPKLWRDMTPEEKGALLLAHHEGKVIEVYGGNGWWSPCLLWVHSQAYRIRSEPKIETVTITLCDGSHDITFNTIDGKPDTASIKMEVI